MISLSQTYITCPKLPYILMIKSWSRDISFSCFCIYLNQISLDKICNCWIFATQVYLCKDNHIHICICWHCGGCVSSTMMTLSVASENTYLYPDLWANANNVIIYVRTTAEVALSLSAPGIIPQIRLCWAAHKLLPSIPLDICLQYNHKKVYRHSIKLYQMT